MHNPSGRTIYLRVRGSAKLPGAILYERSEPLVHIRTICIILPGAPFFGAYHDDMHNPYHSSIYLRVRGSAKLPGAILYERSEPLVHIRTICIILPGAPYI